MNRVCRPVAAALFLLTFCFMNFCAFEQRCNAMRLGDPPKVNEIRKAWQNWMDKSSDHLSGFQQVFTLNSGGKTLHKSTATVQESGAQLVLLSTDERGGQAPQNYATIKNVDYFARLEKNNENNNWDMIELVPIGELNAKPISIYKTPLQLIPSQINPLPFLVEECLVETREVSNEDGQTIYSLKFVSPDKPTDSFVVHVVKEFDWMPRKVILKEGQMDVTHDFFDYEQVDELWMWQRAIAMNEIKSSNFASTTQVNYTFGFLPSAPSAVECRLPYYGIKEPRSVNQPESRWFVYLIVLGVLAIITSIVIKRLN